MTQAYPLSWPESWPRTSEGRRTSNPHLRTAAFDYARRTIFAELRRLGATGIVLSTNVPLRNDGMPYADAARRRMDDPGVAVYFQLRTRPMVMARDGYHDIAQNLRSLALAIEHLRGLERHGGAQMMERAFAGFAQLPPPGGSSAPDEIVNWKELLGLQDFDLPVEDMLVIAESRYRKMAKESHPDQGGDPLAMIRLNMAIKQAREELS